MYPNRFLTICLILLWLSPTHRPPPCRSRKIREDESDPPRKRGVIVAPIAALVYHADPGPMQRVALVLMDPCGKARNSPQAGAERTETDL